MKKVIIGMALFGVLIFGYSEEGSIDFQFITVNHVYGVYSEGKVVSRLRLPSFDPRLKNKGRILFSGFYSPTQLFIVTTKYENDVKVYYYFLYDIKKNIITDLFVDATVGQDLFYLNNDMLYRFDGENLIAFNIASKKIEWSRCIRFDEHVERFWFDVNTGLLYVNCNQFNDTENYSFQIISIVENNVVYKSRGKIVGYVKNNAFEKLFFALKNELFLLNTQTKNYQNIKVQDKTIKLSTGTYYVLLTSLSNRLILGIESRTDNFLSRFLFGYGYNSKFDYYICSLDGLNERIQPIKLNTGIISSENIQSVK